MRVRFQVSGGIAFFPGLAAPRTIDVDTLDANTRDTLIKLIHDGEFFDRPAQPPAAAGAADHQTYQITVEDGGRQRTIRVSDPITDPTLQRLVELLRVL